jgi:hypothetical protein
VQVQDGEQLVVVFLHVDKDESAGFPSSPLLPLPIFLRPSLSTPCRLIKLNQRKKKEERRDACSRSPSPSRKEKRRKEIGCRSLTDEAHTPERRERLLDPPRGCLAAATDKDERLNMAAAAVFEESR